MSIKTHEIRQGIQLSWADAARVSPMRKLLGTAGCTASKSRQAPITRRKAGEVLDGNLRGGFQRRCSREESPRIVHCVADGAMRAGGRGEVSSRRGFRPCTQFMVV